MNNNYRTIAMSDFTVGRGSLDCLGRLGAKKAAVVHGGKSMPDSLKERIGAIMSASGAECRFVARITGEPFFDDISKALEAVNEFKPDLIIAIGGGAVLDTAKGIHLFYEYPDLSIEDSLKPYQLPELGKKARMVAIPTTSGTGSETTSAAVFTDRATNRKHLMLADQLIPHYAIIDSDLTDSLPAGIVAYTGMDALTHAMEASVSVAASAMVRTMAVSSALDLFENLETSMNGDDGSEEKADAREACHVAASMAGVSITNSCAGLAHGFDQPGPWFGIPHGLVCGILLPYTTAFSGIQPSYVKLAKRLGYSAAGEKELCGMLVGHIRDFNKSIGIPAGFAEAGIDEAEYMSKLDNFSELAVQAVATKLSPRVPSIEEAKELFKAAYYGKNPV